MPPSTLQPSVRYEGLPLLESEADKLSPGPASPHLVNRSQQRRRTILEEPTSYQSSPAERNSRASVGPSSLSNTTPSPPDSNADSPYTSVPHLASQQRRKKKTKRWRPWLLKPYVMIVNIIILIIVAVVLEIILKINRDDYGWGTPAFYSRYPQIHIIWTVAPGLVVFLILSQWTEVDRYIKILQPYVDMSRDRVPAEKSVLLNYQYKSKWLVWTDMLQNKHLTPFLANMLTMLAVLVPPLFSSYLYLQQPPDGFVQGITNITVVEQLGLFQTVPSPFTDAAAGFIKASSLYSVSPPPFIRFLPAAAWSSTRVAINDMYEDGIIATQTVCIKSFATCESVTSPLYDAAKSTLSGSSANCTFSAPFPNAGPGSFGMSPAACKGFKAPNTTENAAVAFWVMDATSGMPVATVCKPTLTVQRADVYLNSTTSQLLLVNNQTPLLPTDQVGVDIQSAPFNGSALNGLFFPTATSDDVKAKINSTQLSLGQALATLYSLKTSASPTSSNADVLQSLANDTYAHYLGLVAPSLYFHPLQHANTTGTLHPTTERLFVSPIITHILTAILLVMALLGTTITILHHRAARFLVLTSEPGTLAAAIALAGLSDLAHMLDGKDTIEDMRAILADLHFAIDPVTGRIKVEESEQGYSEIPSTFSLVSPGPSRSATAFGRARRRPAGRTTRVSQASDAPMASVASINSATYLYDPAASFPPSASTSVYEGRDRSTETA